MATRSYVNRLTVRTPLHDGDPDGVWWPESRLLEDEIPRLLGSWPSDAGQIVKVFYFPADWIDRPHALSIPGRRGLVKAEIAPAEGAGILGLRMLNGTRRRLAVVPSNTDATLAARLVATFSGTGHLGQRQPGPRA
jgi:hypothetical protein